MQNDLPYVGLRDVSPDPALMMYLPSARADEIVPLALNGSRLQVACATPDCDISSVRSQYLRLEIDVCIAPADEIHDLLGRMSDSQL
jgi:hypothetical protein